MIKGLCVESGGNGAKFIFDGSTPIAGRNYFLEDISHGSANQNKLFHALLTVFFKYMFDTNTFEVQDGEIGFNLSCPSVEDLKDLLKSRYGQKFSHLNYVDNNYQMIKIPMKKPKDFEGDYDPYMQIPDDILQDFIGGNKKRVKGVLISWSNYSMPQRHKLIDFTFKLMDIFGVDSAKYSDIQQGLIDIENDRLDQLKRDRERKKDVNS